MTASAIERLRGLRARVYATLPVSPVLEQKLLNALPALLECASALEAIMGAEIIYTGAIHETLEASDMHVDLTQKARAALDALAKEVGT